MSAAVEFFYPRGCGPGESDCSQETVRKVCQNHGRELTYEEKKLRDKGQNEFLTTWMDGTDPIDMFSGEKIKRPFVKAVLPGETVVDGRFTSRETRRLTRTGKMQKEISPGDGLCFNDNTGDEGMRMYAEEKGTYPSNTLPVKKFPKTKRPEPRIRELLADVHRDEYYENNGFFPFMKQFEHLSYDSTVLDYLAVLERLIKICALDLTNEAEDVKGVRRNMFRSILDEYVATELVKSSVAPEINDEEDVDDDVKIYYTPKSYRQILMEGNKTLLFASTLGDFIFGFTADVFKSVRTTDLKKTFLLQAIANKKNDMTLHLMRDLVTNGALNLSNMNLKSLPNELGKIDAQGIRALYLNGNDLSEIPKINNFLDVENLDLSNNQLQNLPRFFSLKKLKTLNLSNNQFKKFPERALSELNVKVFFRNQS